MKAAVLDGIGSQFEVREVELDTPKSGELLVKVAASGLCATFTKSSPDFGLSSSTSRTSNFDPTPSRTAALIFTLKPLRNNWSTYERKGNPWDMPALAIALI